MKLEFGKIEIHNFMSYEDEVFDFSVHDGMNLICGNNRDLINAKNGSGKSALVQTLIFALFGQTLNKIKRENTPNRYLPDTEPCNVILWFKADDIQYRIESGLSPKYRNGICNIFKIIDNEEIDLTKSSIAETRKFIEKEILQCDLSIFLRTIILTSDQTYNFFKLSPQQKKEFIEQIFDLTIFGDMYRLIHKDNLTFDKDIHAMQRELLVLNNTYRDYDERHQEFNKTKRAQCVEIKANIIELAETVKSIKEPGITDKSNKLLSCKEKCDKVLAIYNKRFKQCEQKLNILDREQHRLSSIMNEKVKILEKHSSILDKMCEKCTIVFDQHYSISDTKNNIVLLEDKLEKIKHVNEKLTNELSELNISIAEYNDAKIKIKEKDASLKGKIQTYQTTKERASYKIKMLRERFDTLKNEDNPYALMLESAKSSVDLSQIALNEKVEKSKYLKYAEAIVSQDTLRKFIIKDLITLLNNQIKVYLNKIGSKFTCEFDDQMNYTFITDHGSAEYDNFSSGEKMRLSIATSFAFRDFMATRSNIISNVLILDEYIDSNLDETAINALIKILREFIVKYNQSIYIVSHRKEINNDIFNNIIIIEKENGISRVTYEENEEVVEKMEEEDKEDA